MNNLKSINKH